MGLRVYIRGLTAWIRLGRNNVTRQRKRRGRKRILVALDCVRDICTNLNDSISRGVRYTRRQYDLFACSGAFDEGRCYNSRNFAARELPSERKLRVVASTERSFASRRVRSFLTMLAAAAIRMLPPKQFRIQRLRGICTVAISITANNVQFLPSEKAFVCVIFQRRSSR